MSAENWKRCAGWDRHPDGHNVYRTVVLYGPDGGRCRDCCLDAARDLLTKATWDPQAALVPAYLLRALVDAADYWRQEFNTEAHYAQNPHLLGDR